MFLRVLFIFFLLGGNLWSFHKGKPLEVSAGKKIWEEIEGDFVVCRNNGGDPKSLDPHQSDSHRDFMIKNDLFQGLVSFNEKGEIIPGVAKSWSRSEDGLIYIFNLRETARWSNGEPVRASDFVYAFQRLVNPELGLPAAFLLEILKNAPLLIQGKIKDLTQLGVKALDDYTLQIELDVPAPYLLDILAGYGGYPLYKKAIDEQGKEWAKPGKLVCNGPFMLEEWSPNEYVKLKRNPYFWEKETVKPKEVYYLSISDEAVEFKMFRSGKIDMTWINLQSHPSLEFMGKTWPSIVYKDPTLQMGFFVFSTQKGPLKNKDVREALNLCLDREILTQKIFPLGLSTPLDTFSLPGLKNNLQVTAPGKMSLFDRHKRALSLYEAAGYGDHNPLKVDLLLPNTPDRRKMGIGIAGMMKQVLGVEVNLEFREFKIYAEQKSKNMYDIFDCRWILDYNDISNVLSQFETRGVEGASLYANPEFDALFQKARLERDPEKRDLLLSKACQLLLEDYVVCPLFSVHNAFLVHPRLGGVVPNSMGIHPSRYLFIDKTKAFQTF